MSQFPVPSVVPPPDMSAFLKGFATFLGFSEGSHSVSFPFMLSEMVSREVENRLAPIPVSLPVSSLPSVQGTVKSVANPPPGPSTRQSVQSLQAGVPAGGNRGKERSTGGVGLDQVPLDPPSLGKRSRPPKDVPWRIKRSRLAPTRPVSRDRGWDRCASSSRHSRPATQGEGRAMSQGILTEDSVKPS